MRIVRYGKLWKKINVNYVLHGLTGGDYVFNCNPPKTMAGVE